MVTMQMVAAEERDELGLREYILNKGFASDTKTNEICYISFGSHLDTNVTHRFFLTTNASSSSATLLASPYAAHVDPPADFLTRFAGRHFVVKPASQYPKPNEPEDILPINNPKTGVPDGLYTVEIYWVDDTSALVRYSRHRAFIWATGYEAIVEKKDGKWRIKESKGRWIS